MLILTIIIIIIIIIVIIEIIVIIQLRNGQRKAPEELRRKWLDISRDGKTGIHKTFAKTGFMQDILHVMWELDGVCI